MLGKAKSPLTLLVLVLMVAAAAVVGWRLATEPVPSTVTAEDGRRKTCKSQTLRPGDKLRTSQVTVNVYNAGTIAGLADSTQADLLSRGLLPGRTGNAPDAIKTEQTLLLDPKPDSAAVKLVKKQLKRPVEVRKVADDLSAGVDVIVGDNTQGLRGGSPRQIEVKTTTTICVPRATAE